jgi:hypothetical protein
MSEPITFKDEDEEQTWDVYAAAALQGLGASAGPDDTIVVPRTYAASAAKIADTLVLERRKRQG